MKMTKIDISYEILYDSSIACHIFITRMTHYPTNVQLEMHAEMTKHTKDMTKMQEKWTSKRTGLYRF